MARLLHLDASARRTSFSRALSAEVAAAWRAATPGGEYVYRDLAADPVPHMGEAFTELVYYTLEHNITDISRYGEAVRTPEQAAAWAIAEPLLAELAAADGIVIGTPMYNFSIPSTLKSWIDHVTFPKMSLRGRAFVVAGARGGAYGPGTPREPYDHEERYLRAFFEGHFDVEDVEFVHTELTNALLDPALARRLPEHERSRAAALARARELGAALARRTAPAGSADSAGVSPGVSRTADANGPAGGTADANGSAGGTADAAGAREAGAGR
ncbi:FMN-dependent NADH-azoreductase [Bailinhaonella thermotolerans]|uniref:FMN dependent NADH:quinone oxidoreductase n=2 Tax=Bailinhaonella thermotolerans TaxID=1070861 RepID=A0A3A4A7B9_9ACTN|nr:FMN-dependent NADH-azoreductase [Bailinhaonella thermotolerans]